MEGQESHARDAALSWVRVCAYCVARPLASATELVGLTGILVRQKGKTRFVISVDLIQRSVAVELDEADLVAER